VKRPVAARKESSGAEKLKHRNALLAVLGITIAGAVLRLIPVITNDFPLNDGGLFFAMMRGIQAQGFGIPETVSYNGHAIPFAYPPLGLLLGAAISSISGASLLDVQRFGPVVLSILTIPAAFLLFRQLLLTEFRALIATAAFAVIPRSYDWMIAGGGITRSPGLLAAILTLAAGVRLYQTGRFGWAVTTGLLLGVAGLTHPQASVFAGLSLLVVLPFTAVRRWSAFRGFVIVVAVAFVVLLPWLLMVLTRYGSPTLLGAAQSGGSLLAAFMAFISLRFSGGLFQVVSFIGAFGLIVCVINRQWLFPIWIVVVFVAASRGAQTYGSLAIAGAAAYAVADGFRLSRIPEPKLMRELRHAPVAILLMVLIAAAAFADGAASPRATGSPLHALSTGQRAALAWIASDTFADSRFLVISGTPWEIDAISEWLPVLSERQSVATVQGTEWFGSGVFTEFERRHRWLQSCAAVTEFQCAKLWSEQFGPVDYVMTVRSREARLNGYDCCLAFADRVIASGGEQVYANEDVRIVRVDFGGG
jgi:hypothetical protein